MKKILFLIGFVAIVLSSCNNDNDENLDLAIDPVPEELNYFDEIITLKSGIQVAKKGNDYVYLGDILLTNKQFERLDKDGSIFSGESLTASNNHLFPKEGQPTSPIYGGINLLPTTRAVEKSPYQGIFWAMLRYTFSPKLNTYQKKQISDAISHIETLTNARFYNATGKPTTDPTYGFDYPYVEFTPSNINNSHIGRIGGKQVLNLYNFDRRTIVHEICHALGMFHEQCRKDRDDYITINFDNISSANRHNFQKETRNYYIIGAFDFNSIMLYSSYAFALDYSKPTMTKKDGSSFLANRDGLSEMDRKFINTFYLPFKARKDICAELDVVVYDRNNNPLTEEQRINLEKRLNINRCSYPLEKE